MYLANSIAITLIPVDRSTTLLGNLVLGTTLKIKIKRIDEVITEAEVNIKLEIIPSKTLGANVLTKSIMKLIIGIA